MDTDVKKVEIEGNAKKSLHDLDLEFQMRGWRIYKMLGDAFNNILYNFGYYNVESIKYSVGHGFNFDAYAIEHVPGEYLSAICEVLEPLLTDIYLEIGETKFIAKVQCPIEYKLRGDEIETENYKFFSICIDFRGRKKYIEDKERFENALANDEVPF